MRKEKGSDFVTNAWNTIKDSIVKINYVKLDVYVSINAFKGAEASLKVEFEVEGFGETTTIKVDLSYKADWKQILKDAIGKQIENLFKLLLEIGEDIAEFAENVAEYVEIAWKYGVDAVVGGAEDALNAVVDMYRVLAEEVKELADAAEALQKKIDDILDKTGLTAKQIEEKLGKTMEELAKVENAVEEVDKAFDEGMDKVKEVLCFGLFC